MPYTSQAPFVAGPLAVASMETLRTNLAETAAAKATTAGRHFVATGVGSIAERACAADVLDTVFSTTSTTFVNSSPSGPTVTLTTGPQVIVMLYGYCVPDSTSAFAQMGFAISGATSSVATENRAVVVSMTTAKIGVAASYVGLVTVTPGTNTFTAQYRGSVGTVTFDHRRIAVLPF